jgi:membrane carboxypeptidase/penicillin-binding protein
MRCAATWRRWRERNVGDGAVVVLDNASGEILAYVGNAGGGEVDGVMALRQAGSTLKPFLYELALERGCSPPPRCWTTRRSTSRRVRPVRAAELRPPFKGYVSVRTSLAGSLNVPAVRTLMLTGWSASTSGCARWAEQPDRAGRLLRLFAGAGFGRRQPAGAGQRLPHAGQRRHARQRHPAPRAPESAAPRARCAAPASSSATSCPTAARAA